MPMGKNQIRKNSPAKSLNVTGLCHSTDFIALALKNKQKKMQNMENMCNGNIKANVDWLICPPASGSENLRATKINITSM